MLSRFSGKRPGYRRVAALVFSVLVAGCWAHTAELKTKGTPLPYRFQITGFNDERNLTDEMFITGFNQEDFLFLLQSKMTYSLFANTPAKLKLALKDYQLSHHERDYTLSMTLHMQAISDLNKTLVDKDFRCVVDHFGGVGDVANLFKNAYNKPERFTKDGWRVKIEEELLDECVQNVVTQFSRAVVRGTPSQGGM